MALFRKTTWRQKFLTPLFRGVEEVCLRQTRERLLIFFINIFRINKKTAGGDYDGQEQSQESRSFHRRSSFCFRALDVPDVF